MKNKRQINFIHKTTVRLEEEDLKLLIDITKDSRSTQSLAIRTAIKVYHKILEGEKNV